MELVAAMNEILCHNHPMDFLPVDVDQPGSHLAARRWLVEFGIPLPDALRILRQKCACFNPAKVFRSEFPRSLGFFTKSITAEWRRVLRDREQFKLFPKDEMHVEPRHAQRPAGKFEPLGSLVDTLTKQLGVKQ